MTATMSGPRGSIVFSGQPDAPVPIARDRIEFAVLASTPRWSREFTARFLRRYAQSDAIETAALVISELVTNAVQAARQLDHRSTIGLSLRLFRGCLVAEILDSSPEVPFLVEEADALAEHGRGLHLVDALTDGRWGWFRWPASHRKVVWCQLVTGGHELPAEHHTHQ